MSPDVRSDDGRRFARRISRRELLGRGVRLGLAIPLAGGLLAACGPFGDDEPTPAPEPTPTATPATPEADPTPTPEPTPTPTPEPTPTPAGPEEGGTLVIAVAQDPISLHPDADGATRNWIVIAQIHNALVEVDHDFELEPVLAASYEVAEDGSSYTFSLHEGVRFHDGAELTAADVQYTFDWYRDPANAAVKSSDYQRVASVEAPDGRTVVVRMAQPDGTFPRWGAANFIVPAGYHGRVGAAGHSLEPIGTGPFVLREWVREGSLRLEAFADYFRGRPHLDGIEVRIMPDPSARAAALRDGEVDAALDLPREDSPRIEADDAFTTVSAPGLDCNHFPLNNRHPVLADRGVRRAMLHALDRQRMIDAVYGGAATLATSYLSPALDLWYEPDVQEYPHAPERAAELLEGAGWLAGPDGVRERAGQRLSFTCTTIAGDQPRRQQAELARDMFREVGIEMTLAEAPVADILAGMRAGELDASVFNWVYGGWAGEPDARTTLHSGGFDNFSQFQNGQIDQLLLQGVGLTADGARRERYADIQRIVAQEVPFLYLMFWHTFHHFGPRVRGVPESARWGVRLYRLTPSLWIAE